MTTKKLCALAIPLALAACSGSDEARAKEVVRANITDPDSAKFGQYAQVDSKKRDWACLEVNYRGSEGGYVGNAAARLVKSAGSEVGSTRVSPARTRIASG